MLKNYSKIIKEEKRNYLNVPPLLYLIPDLTKNLWTAAPTDGVFPTYQAPYLFSPEVIQDALPPDTWKNKFIDTSY